MSVIPPERGPAARATAGWKPALRWLLVLLLAGCASATHDGDLNVLVYNIHAGKDAAGVDNLERVAELINSRDADVVLLQEVDRGTKRSGGVDQLGELMRRTRMHGAFGKSLDYQGGHYGIAVLSRWPISTDGTVPLRTEPPQPRAGGSLEPRVALVVTTGGIRVINTHLDASREDIWRLQESATLVQLIEKDGRSRILVGGDLNATPESAAYARVRETGLLDAFSSCGSGDGLTYPAGTPVKRIDYLLLGRGFRCRSAVVLATDASDHRPLLVILSAR